MPRYAAIVTLFAVAACAPMGEAPMPGTETVGTPPARQCFYPNQVINFRQGDTQSLYLKVMGGDVYQVSSGGCLDLDFTNALTITPDVGPSDRLCTGDTARILVQSSSMPNVPCRARVVRRLTEVEVAALPSRQRP